MKRLIKPLLTLGIILLVMSAVNAQTSKEEKQAAIKNMIESNTYVFKADEAIPQGGASRQLTDLYDLNISANSVTAYLPYFGRAYLAPDPTTTEGGIKFTTTNFTYQQKPGKKGSWQILIKPKDNDLTNWRDVQQMQLNVSSSGYASLIVISSHRDPITFEGIIEAKE